MTLVQTYEYSLGGQAFGLAAVCGATACGALVVIVTNVAGCSHYRQDIGKVVCKCI